MRCKMFDPPKLRGKYLNKVLKSGWHTVGAMNERLEEAVAEFWGVSKDNVLLTSSATAACQVIMDFIKVPAKVTRATFPGIYMIENVDWDCFNRPARILTDIGGARFIDSSCAAVGAKYIIHDIAHSWLLRTPRPDFAFASMYPTKLFCGGAEGGALFFRDSAWKEELRFLKDCGIRPGTGVDGGIKWGRPAHMGDIIAACNLEALDNTPKYVRHVHCIWQCLAELAQKYGIPYRDQPVRPYLMQIETDEVKLFREKLKEFGWPSQHNFPDAPLVTLPTNSRMKPYDIHLLMTDVRRIIDGLGGTV